MTQPDKDLKAALFVTALLLFVAAAIIGCDPCPDCQMKIPTGYKLVYRKYDGKYAIKDSLGFMLHKDFLSGKTGFTYFKKPDVFTDSCLAKGLLMEHFIQNNSANTFQPVIKKK